MAHKAQVEYLRTLAGRLAEASAAPANAQKRKRWADHNDLRAIGRPLLWICPDDDGAWLELVPERAHRCADPDLRALENRLLKYLYHAEHFDDDFVFEPRVYFPIPGEYTGYLYGHVAQATAWGIAIDKQMVGKNAYQLAAFVETEADYAPLLAHEVDFIVDEAEYTRQRALYGEVLGGILDVRFQLPYSVLVQSLLIELVHLRGLENLLYDLYDHPDTLHAVLAHMARSKARLLDRLEAARLLFDNRTNIYTGSGGLGYTNAPAKADADVLLSDMWGFADAQEFSAVSAEMFERFALVNQAVGLSKFGLGCYGCCEPLDDKYDAIFRHLPGIRRLSVSPWSNVDLAAERIGRRAIFSWKPNPATVCTGFDADSLRAELSHTAHAARACHTEVILKDIRTCGETPVHLQRFAKLFRETFDA